MIHFDALKSFAVFADQLNFTRAARLLRISQPALHVKIRNLAGELGVPLYRREGRRLELTEPGRRVARFGREWVERANDFAREVRGGAAEEPLVLAAGEGAYLYLLGEGIRQFRRRTRTPLRLLTLDGEGAVDAVRTGRAHLGVASLESRPDDVVAEILAKVPQVLAMPPKHRLAAKSEVRLRDLEGEKLIVPPAGRPHRAMLSRALQSAGVNWTVAVEASGWELMLLFARLGLGLAVVNGSCRIPAGLVSRPIRELPEIHYHVFHLKGADRARELRDLLLEHVG